MGTKHHALTEQEMSDFRVNPVFVEEIARYAAKTKQSTDHLRILDWGCGRGRLVAALVESGYDAYGIDIDQEPIFNGYPYFEMRGFDPRRRLRLWSPPEEVSLAAGSFDLIVSEQVLEHVSDLDLVAQEMARFLKPHGECLHSWPARRRIVEPHLHMPLVHWLPKNELRKVWIGAMVSSSRTASILNSRVYVLLSVFIVFLVSGIIHDSAYSCVHAHGGSSLKHTTLAHRIRVYHKYSVDKTFYRSPRSIQEVFADHGFHATIHGSGHPRFRAIRVVLRLCGLWDWYCRTLHTAWRKATLVG